jgi:hypothetical protein
MTMVPHSVPERDLPGTSPFVGAAHQASSRQDRFRVTRIGRTFDGSAGLRRGTLISRARRFAWRRPQVSVLSVLLVIVGIFVPTLMSQPAQAANSPEWSNPQPLVSPSTRFGAAMAYDPATKTTVLFGGTGGTTYQSEGTLLNDTWEWNGSTWTVEHPSTSPPTNHFPTEMTYDPFTHGMLLFNGRTWEWNGSNWSQITTADSPPIFVGAIDVLSTDTGNDTVLLLAEDANQVMETWEWNGTNWVEQTPLIEPPVAVSTMAYDSLHN